MSGYQYRQLGLVSTRDLSLNLTILCLICCLINTFAFNEWMSEAFMNMYINHQMHRTMNESMKHSVCAQITKKEFINRLNFHTYLVYLKYSCLYTPYTLRVQDKLECHWCFYDGPGGSHSLVKREAVLSISLQAQKLPWYLITPADRILLTHHLLKSLLSDTNLMARYQSAWKLYNLFFLALYSRGNWIWWK